MSSKDCEQGIRISLNPPASERSAALLKLVASGRGSLDFALGDTGCRVRLLAHGLDWSGVVVAWRGRRPVGYAQMRFAGRGPYQPGWRVFLTEYGKLRGVWAGLVFHVAELWNWRSVFYFYGLKVLPRERRQGIGKALVNAVLEHARLCGYDSVELDVGPNFEIAKRLYERCGFEEIRRSRLWSIAWFLPFRGLCFMRCKRHLGGIRSIEFSGSQRTFVRKVDPVGARAWLQGKLLIACLIEKMIAVGDLFSPRRSWRAA